MALYDWNHDGEKDWQDSYIEYQIYKNSTGQKNNSSYTPSNGISTFGAILSTVGGLFLGALLVALFAGDNVENVPVIITIILWIICGSILAVFCDNNGIQKESEVMKYVHIIVYFSLGYSAYEG